VTAFTGAFVEALRVDVGVGAITSASWLNLIFTIGAE